MMDNLIIIIKIKTQKDFIKTQKDFKYVIFLVNFLTFLGGSGSVVECLTQDRRAAGLSLTGVTALWSLSKTHLF